MAIKEKKYKSCVTVADVRRMKRETKDNWKWGRGGKSAFKIK